MSSSSSRQPSKVTTEEYRSRLSSYSSLASSQLAVGLALGVPVPVGDKLPASKLAKLADDGPWLSQRVPPGELVPLFLGRSSCTLAVFASFHLAGTWLAEVSRSQTVAFCDGVITDVNGSAQTVRRHVTDAWRLIPRAVNGHAVPCSCADPVVFGHVGNCVILKRVARPVSQPPSASSSVRPSLSQVRRRRISLI